ncbi:hypothetical protein V6N13_038936 [Hibiscus sabdariffa]
MRRLPVNNVCPFCQSHDETQEHLFRDCVCEVADVEVGVTLCFHPSCRYLEGLDSLLFRYSLKQKSFASALVVGLVSRNKLVHEDIHTSADESGTFVKACVSEILLARCSQRHS